MFLVILLLCFNDGRSHTFLSQLIFCRHLELIHMLWNSDSENNFLGYLRTDYSLHHHGNCDYYPHTNADLGNHRFPSRCESHYSSNCHENGPLCLHCRRDGEKSGGHISDHRVNRNDQIDLFCRSGKDCSRRLVSRLSE